MSKIEVKDEFGDEIVLEFIPPDDLQPAKLSLECYQRDEEAKDGIKTIDFLFPHETFSKILSAMLEIEKEFKG